MRELIFRNLNAPVDQDEMESLVERYIQVRKNKAVRIGVRSGIFHIRRDITLLCSAFNDAREWFKKNEDKI